MGTNGELWVCRFPTNCFRTSPLLFHKSCFSLSVVSVFAVSQSNDERGFWETLAATTLPADDCLHCFSVPILDNISSSDFSYYCVLAGEAKGQPLCWSGEGSRVVKRELRRSWMRRREPVMQARVSSLVPGVNTLYKRKGVKVVPVDTNHKKGERPAGDPDWREKVLQHEKILRSLGGGGCGYV